MVWTHPSTQFSYSLTVYYSVDQLYDNSIDLDPEYQRGMDMDIFFVFAYSDPFFLLQGIVWSDTKQSNLIDSLFHNYYIPPIIFGGWL